MRDWGDVRLVPVAAAAWSGSMAAACGRAGVLAAMSAWIAVALAAAAVWGSRAVRASPAIAVAAVACGVAGASALAWLDARAWIADADGPVEVRGLAVAVRELDDPGQGAVAGGGPPRVAMRVEVTRWRPATDGAWRDGGGRVIVIVPADGAPARGGELTLVGTLEAADASGADAFADARVVRAAPPRGWRAAVARSRDAFGAVLDRATGGGAPLVRGMVLGDTSDLPDAVRADLRASGLAHLTAVSGAHFAILGAALGALGRRLGLAPAALAAGTLAASAGLAVTVDGGASVVRALGMAAIAALAVALGRRHHVMPALAATTTMLVVASPGLAREASLALSVAAVAGIALLAPPISRRLRRVVAPPLADIAAMTVAAQAACLPLLAAIDADVGPWAVAANAIAAPFAVPVTLAGVIGLALAGPAPALALGAAQVACWSAWPIEVASRAFASAPGGTARWPADAPGVVAGIAVLAAVAVAARASPRIARAGLLAALTLWLVAVSPALRWLPPSWGGALRGWTVVACDVGQGDALVVRSGGAVVLVDAGPRDGDVVGCLERLGVGRVDLLVLTHEHADHTGGAGAVVDAVPVVRAWLPHAPDPRTAAAVAEVPTSIPAAGDALRLGGVDVVVLQGGPAPAGRDGTEVNDSSTVLRLEADGVTVVALGDVESDAQRRLLASGLAPAQVVKVAHHGSEVQDPAVAAALRARFALVSVGDGNGYGHPAAATLDMYASAGARVLRTDLCGDLAIGVRDGVVAPVRECRTPVAG